MKNQKGVTLIALVVTIVVLLILAGVAIAMLRGDNGILKEATKASSATSAAEVREALLNVINEATTKYYDLKYVETNETLKGTVATTSQSKYIAQQIIDSSISGALKGKVTIKEGSTDITAAVNYKGGDITITYKDDKTKYAVYSTSSASGDLDTSNWK